MVTSRYYNHPMLAASVWIAVEIRKIGVGKVEAEEEEVQTTVEKIIRDVK